MIFIPTKMFPCYCMGEGLTITPLTDSEDISEGEVLMSEDKKLRDCAEAPFFQLSFWEFGTCKKPRWNWWWRLKIGWRVFRDGSPWPDQVLLTAAHAKNFANHLLYLIGKVQREMELEKKQESLVKDGVDTVVDIIKEAAREDIEVEEPHPMLCVQHGGSPQCEKVNKDNGFECPKCADELSDLGR